MMRLATALFASILLLPLLMTTAFAERTAEEILDVWEARQESLPSLKVKIAGTARRPQISYGETEFEIVLWIQGSNGSLRSDSTQVDKSANGHIVETTRRITASNGQGDVRTLLYDEDHAVPEGIVDYDGRNTSLLDFNVSAVYLACRIGMLPYKTRMFHRVVSEGSSPKGDIRLDCYPIACRANEISPLQLSSPHPTASLYVDRDTSRINRMTGSDTNRRVIRDLVIRYDEQSHEGWFPSSWEASSMDSDGEVTEHHEMRVTEFTASPTIPPETFELTFPTHAIVYGNVPGGHYMRVLANGEFEKISFAEAAAAFEAAPKRRAYTLSVDSGFLSGLPVLAILGCACLISLVSLGGSLIGLCAVAFSRTPRWRLAMFLGVISVGLGLGMAALLKGSPLGVAAWASLSGACLLFGTCTIVAAMARRRVMICRG